SALIEVAVHALGDQLVVAQDDGDGRSQLVRDDGDHAASVGGGLCLPILDRPCLLLCGGPARALRPQPNGQDDDGGDGRDSDQREQSAHGCTSGFPRLRNARASATNSSIESDSARRCSAIPVSCAIRSTAAASSAYPGAARSVFWSCFRLQPNATRVRERTSRSSPSVRRGGWCGVMRTTVESTLGTGRNAPRPTWNSRSTSATVCTPTVSAPYSAVSGAATSRSATSRW